MPNTRNPCPAFNFTTHPSSSPFAVPVQAFISNQTSKYKFEYITTGAHVFDFSSPERVLLIQRAASDSMPNRWEVPGGGCNNEDQTILHAVARELWEEAGLTAASIGPQVGDGYLFITRKGKLVHKASFIVGIDKGADGSLDVKLDPKEHQNYVWATEEEVKAGKFGDIELKFTTKDQEKIILEAFRTRKQMRNLN